MRQPDRHPRQRRPRTVEVSRLRLGGREIEYLDVPAGAGSSTSPLVFLHEGLGSLDSWRDFPLLVRAALGEPRILVYSRFGYGRSTPRPGSWPTGYMHDEALEVLPALLAATDIESPLLIGHSDGASIAIIHAGAGAPVTGVVLLAPHVFVEEQTIDGVAAATVRFRRGRLRRQLARLHEDPDSTFGGWSNAWLEPSFRRWNIEASLRGIQAPALVVQGDADPYGTCAQVESIRRQCAGPVQVRSLPGVGHAPQAEALDLTIASITEFAIQLS